MARGFPSSTVFLCLLLMFSVSSARVPFDFPELDETNHVSSLKSDSAANTNTILLPTDKPESESESEFDSGAMIQGEPQTETADSKISEPNSETLDSMEVSTRSSLNSDHVPLTLIHFRPINRHDIPRRPMPLSFRLGGHRCRHGHNFKPWEPRLPRREISYGNDMILSKFEDGGAVHQIPPRWTRFDHVAPRFSKERMMERSEEMERPHPHHHHHHHHHEAHEEGAFMKGIRKFLNHF